MSSFAESGSSDEEEVSVRIKIHRKISNFTEIMIYFTVDSGSIWQFQQFENLRS